jgi:hypothetical protein
VTPTWNPVFLPPTNLHNPGLTRISRCFTTFLDSHSNFLLSMKASGSRTYVRWNSPMSRRWHRYRELIFITLNSMWSLFLILLVKCSFVWRRQGIHPTSAVNVTHFKAETAYWTIHVFLTHQSPELRLGQDPSTSATVWFLDGQSFSACSRIVCHSQPLHRAAVSP